MEQERKRVRPTVAQVRELEANVQELDKKCSGLELEMYAAEELLERKRDIIEKQKKELWALKNSYDFIVEKYNNSLYEIQRLRNRSFLDRLFNK